MLEPTNAKPQQGENQHFVNKAHLRHFTIAGELSLIWEYDKLSGRIRQKSIKKICSRINYYAQSGKDGHQDNTTIERKLGSLVEDPSSPVIAGLHSADGKRILLEGMDKGHVAVFVGTLLARGPAFRDGVHDIHKKLVQITFEQLLAAGGLPPMPPLLKEKVEEHGLWNEIQADIDSSVSIRPMIDLGARIARELAAKAWTFLMPADGMNFVTSDNPVSFRLPDEIRAALGPIPIGPAHPLSEITVPLRKDLMLVCHPVQVESEDELRAACGDVIKLTADQTHGANLRPIRSALQYVYAPEKSANVEKQVAAMRGAKQRLVAE